MDDLTCSECREEMLPSHFGDYELEGHGTLCPLCYERITLTHSDYNKRLHEAADNLADEVRRVLLILHDHDGTMCVSLRRLLSEYDATR